MPGSPIHSHLMIKRYQLIIGAAIVAAILGGVIYQGFQSTVFYHTPGEILAAPSDFQGRTIRIGALVEKGSSRWDPEAVQLSFKVTEDSQNFIAVVYEGVKPDMFREGQGVVVEGRMDGSGVFRAETLLVKHSEEYSAVEKYVDKEQLYRTLSKQ